MILAGTVLPPDIAAKTDDLRAAYQATCAPSCSRRICATSTCSAADGHPAGDLRLLVDRLRLARRVTEPIQALADGTRRISQGDLDHRVEVAVDDELRILVDGFNHMTEELKRSRELVDRQYRELQTFQQASPGGAAERRRRRHRHRPDERILTCNGAALDILAQREEDVLGRAFGGLGRRRARQAAWSC